MRTLSTARLVTGVWCTCYLLSPWWTWHHRDRYQLDASTRLASSLQRSESIIRLRMGHRVHEAVARHRRERPRAVRLHSLAERAASTRQPHPDRSGRDLEHLGECGGVELV